MEQVLDSVRSLEGILVLAPEVGSDFPEIAWGDYFFYHAPDGRMPRGEQPFATIVTKDYPDDYRSQLDPPGRWRVNIHVGQAKFRDLVGERSRDAGATDVATTDVGAPDFAESDVFLPHPLYAALGWVAVVNPGTRTTASVIEALRNANADQRRRLARRAR